MKRIILCSDGTWNKVGKTTGGRSLETNVVKLTRAILPTDATGVSQVVFYDAGVGSGNILDRALGGAFGTGLDKNVKDLYRFLAQNYADGDEVCLFGFSRGAHTARSTAGMIRNCGVLKKEHLDLLETEAYELYRSHEHDPKSATAMTFRSEYSVETRVKFIGVWDTVGARGIPLPTARQAFTVIPGLRRWHRRKFEFHDMELSSTVDRAFHAIAIDERRSSFVAALWDNTDGRKNVVQAWFPGDHSNVGGGHTESTLSDCALLAMVEHAKRADIAFDMDYLASITNPSYKGRLYPSPRGIWRAVRHEY